MMKRILTLSQKVPQMRSLQVMVKPVVIHCIFVQFALMLHWTASSFHVGTVWLVLLVELGSLTENFLIRAYGFCMACLEGRRCQVLGVSLLIQLCKLLLKGSIKVLSPQLQVQFTMYPYL